MKASSTPALNAGRNLAVGSLMLSMFFAMASNTMVLTGLPRIIEDLDGTQTQYTWIITTSLLTLTVGTPVWARLSDLFSRQRLMQVAVVVYALATAGAGLAQDPWFIVGCRFFIGVGAGGIVTLVQLMVTDLTTPEERPRYFGYLGANMAVATVAAPALGGLVVDLGGWRWCFFSTVPVAFLSLGILQLGMRGQHAVAVRQPQRAPFDLRGAALVTSTTLLLMVWLTVVGPEVGWASSTSMAVLAVGAVGAVAVVLVERKVESPMLPLHLLRHPEILKVLGASVAVGAATFGGAVYVAQYLQDARGLSTGTAGLLMVPMAAATFVSSILAGRIISRSGNYKPVVVAGAALSALGAAPLAFLALDTSLWTVALATTALGFGLGAVGQQLIVVAQQHLSPAELNIGSALVMFVRNVASVLCLCVFSVVVAGRLDATPGPAGYAEGAALVFAITTGAAVVGLVLLAMLRRAPARLPSAIPKADPEPVG
ncbi:MFS transporter [Nocardioides sp. cx-169]|uniref:MFS transporter n=1 Tax=Nocardioides sp. cx-169 TaxID=2899080 RepID=UPI001E325C16|nr:MFS transporter [Nocardioides sp. cx-169]MCD4532900.1 MFS transporter [Nocardioides sp. cx-169]